MESSAQDHLVSVHGVPVAFACSVCFAQSPSSQNWANSPLNWKNNPNNWQNSSQNWQNNSQNWNNSPDNWKNSANNFNSTNGIFDSSGNRVGYSAPGPNGSLNIFNNDGSRRAYAPSAISRDLVRIGSAARAAYAATSGDPSLHDADARGVKSDHVGAESRQQPAQYVTEAEKLRRMRRGKTQRTCQRHVEQLHAIAHGARHVERGPGQACRPGSRNGRRGQQCLHR